MKHTHLDVIDLIFIIFLKNTALARPKIHLFKVMLPAKKNNTHTQRSEATPAAYKIEPCLGAKSIAYTQ
jgi:hypothetical protein